MDNIFLADTRVYIAGVLMPTQEVSITSAINQPPTATIVMPADYRLFNVGKNDRVPVHIFQRETYVDSGEFILVFEGFIDSRLYLNTALQRTVTYNAVGVMDILNDVRIEFLHEFNDLYRAIVPGQSETQQTNKDAIGFPTCFFLHGLNVEGNSGKTHIEFPFQYLSNVYQYVGGPESAVDENGNAVKERIVAKKEHSSELAKFYAKQAKHLNLPHRYTKVPFFDDTFWDGCDKALFPILRGMQTQEAVDLLSKQLMSSGPSLQTAMSLLNLVSDPMDFEYANYASPAYRPGVENAKPEYEKSPRLISTCLKPVLSEAIPPMCNVLFRSQVTRIESRDQFKGVPTRVQVHDVHTPTALIQAQNQGADSQHLLDIAMTVLYPIRSMSKDTLKDPTSQKIASYIMDTEEYTGPWVRQVGTPKWWQWADSFSKKGKPMSETSIQLKHVFCHRQLLQARYMTKQLSIQTTYNPYITPGFPGVVFDAESTDMSFAGYVVGVSHHIGAQGMTTIVEMGFVRSLPEAAVVDIVHPMKEMQELFHDTAKMTKIYNHILGIEPTEAHPQYKGTEAKTFEDIYLTYQDTADTSYGPQNNAQAAYMLQRRNICSFDNFVKFMGLKVEESEDSSGNLIPSELTGDYITQRSKVRSYEIAVFPEPDEKQKKDTDKAAAAVTSGSGAPQAQQKPDAAKAEEKTKPADAVEPKKETRTEKEESRKYIKPVDTDVREILRAVAKDAFSKHVYS